VDEDGVSRTASTDGHAPAVRWAEVTGATRVRLPGFPFVWLHTAGRRRAIWIPLYLKDMGGFRRAVSKYTTPEHPLRRVLEPQAEPPAAADPARDVGSPDP
jgi:hypothetical protein